jgi:hypothetical protein
MRAVMAAAPALNPIFVPGPKGISEPKIQRETSVLHLYAKVNGIDFSDDLPPGSPARPR